MAGAGSTGHSIIKSNDGRKHTNKPLQPEHSEHDSILQNNQKVAAETKRAQQEICAVWVCVS